MAEGDEGTLQTRLEHFLERLGRTVERPRDNLLIARHRTALVEEETRFNVVDSSKGKPLKKSTNILSSPLVDLPPEDEYPDSYYFDDFLDRTVQAERMAEGLLSDKELAKVREDFIPQHVAIGGERLEADAVSYFFDSWLGSEDQRLLAVLAPAGYGKTVLTGAIACEMGRRYLDAPPGRRPPFPYLIPFGQFRRLTSFEAMILSSLQRKGVTDYTSGAFAYLVQQNRVVLILDGFDELLEERPEEARKNLRELIETLEGRGKVVITARSTFFRTSDQVADFLEYYLGSDQVRVLELQQFDRAQRHAYIEKHFSNVADRNRAIGLVDSEGLREPMGSPLLLKETVEVLGETSDGVGLDKEAGRRQLFSALEASVYQRERERHNHRFPDEAQRAFLELLASEMLDANIRGFEWESIQVAASEAASEEGGSDSELDQLADHHFLTVREAQGDVQFNHQVFREYFQARSLIGTCADGDAGRIMALLAQRPIPEEVCRFLAELDPDGGLPKKLLDSETTASRPAPRLANNLGALFAAYRDPGLLVSLLESIPEDVPLGFRIEEIDLAGSNWSGRYLQGMQFVDCNLSKAEFAGADITDLTLRGTNVTGTRMSKAQIESLTVERDERLFGRVDSLKALKALGADTGLEDAKRREDLATTRRKEVTELIKGRINRFYVAGRSDTADSRWDSDILEKNLFGGVAPRDLKFIKSKLVPRMQSVGIVTRTREHGNVVYHLSNDAEDDARALMERDEVCGVFTDLVARLAGE